MIKEISEGIIGDVYFAHSWYSTARKPIGFGKEVPPPENLDWDLWQGPAPRVPYRDNIHPYNWHWFWHWGTGEALNNGTHMIDVARWAMGVEYPETVASQGGRFHYIGEDDWECPDTQTISYEFTNRKIITWEARSCNPFQLYGSAVGIIFYGTNGAIIYMTDSYKVYDKDNQLVNEVTSELTRKSDPRNTIDPGLGSDHTVNFIESIRGKQKLNAPIDEGHKSTLLCQMANISLRIGQSLHINQKTGRPIGNKEADKLWTREYESGWEPKV
ncbi:Gfo/Idh/MocA family protein [Bacteroidota bacterium]